MPRNRLSILEYKKAWEWDLRRFTVRVRENTMLLYNENNNLITGDSYTCKFDEFNAKSFGIQCIHKLTKEEFKKVKELYERKYASRDKLWEFYRLPITNEKFYKKFNFSLIHLRKKAVFRASVTPNALGYYYAEIISSINKKQLRFINDNALDLLLDLFFCLECFIGREEIPFTFSQAWYNDFDAYGNRRYPESIAKYNVAQSYNNIILDRIIKAYNNTTKTSFIHAHDLLHRLGQENKYYILDCILNNKHFSIDENEYIIYTPTIPRVIEHEK